MIAGTTVSTTTSHNGSSVVSFTCANLPTFADIPGPRSGGEPAPESALGGAASLHHCYASAGKGTPVVAWQR